MVRDIALKVIVASTNENSRARIENHLARLWFWQAIPIAQKFIP